MKTRFICSLLLILGLSVSGYCQVENRSVLKIKDFMALNFEGNHRRAFNGRLIQSTYTSNGTREINLLIRVIGLIR